MASWLTASGPNDPQAGPAWVPRAGSAPQTWTHGTHVDCPSLKVSHHQKLRMCEDRVEVDASAASCVAWDRAEDPPWSSSTPLLLPLCLGWEQVEPGGRWCVVFLHKAFEAAASGVFLVVFFNSVHAFVLPRPGCSLPVARAAREHFRRQKGGALPNRSDAGG